MPTLMPWKETVREWEQHIEKLRVEDPGLARKMQQIWTEKQREYRFTPTFEELNATCHNHLRKSSACAGAIEVVGVSGDRYEWAAIDCTECGEQFAVANPRALPKDDEQEPAKSSRWQKRKDLSLA